MNLEEMDFESLVGLLKLRARANRRIAAELTELKRRQYDLERDQSEAENELHQVIFALAHRAATDE